jgi:hypothetical protein
VIAFATPRARLAATAFFATAVVLLVAADRAGAVTSFQSPSGNIGCVIDRQSGVRCDIRNRDWRPPPKPASCQLDWGQGLEVGRRGRGHFVCAGDTTLGQGRRLAYGKAIRRGRFRCVSRRSGMRCVNRRNGHGFALSRERARRF